MSSPRRVLLGVCGGIAAYKAAQIVRCLQERGAEVRCILTRAATAFVTPLTLEILSGHQVYQEEYLSANGSGRELHIDAATWGEVLLVAPATAHLLARLALGLADDFLSTTALAFQRRLVVAPAMHENMWNHPAVQGHVRTLRDRGVEFIGPVHGRLASGDEGTGRLEEPEVIAGATLEAERSASWTHRRVLVTAGPTREPIDPVRFLSNRSSGRMGFALAAAAAARGATVRLVSGPVGLDTPIGVERVDVVTAQEMEEAVLATAGDADVIIMAAAVADFRPRESRDQKIKKGEGPPKLELEPTHDILRGLRDAAAGAYRVGFAAETEDFETEAERKLNEKGADMIVVNDVSRSDVGFAARDNEVTILRAGMDAERIPRLPKREVAERILDAVESALERRSDSA